MKIYYFESGKREKHITRFHCVHEFTSKKAANAERADLLKRGNVCSPVKMKIV